MFIYFAEELFQTLLDLSRLSEGSILSDEDETTGFRTSLPGMGSLLESNKSKYDCIFKIGLIWYPIALDLRGN